MTKRDRHAMILDLIRHHRVVSQEALRELLLEQGTHVTQATLSRDLRELRLVKVPDPQGMGHYAIPEDWESTPSLEALLPTLFLGAEGVSHLLVIRTMKGGAQTVAAGLDWEEWPEVLGTLAGDDTILIILRDPSSLAAVKARIEALAGADGE
ncbi:MAG: arginine repressor [Gemmatimonadota bacterium]